MIRQTMRTFMKKLGCALLMALAGSVMAQQVKDKSGGKDHEVIGRYAGSVLINYGVQQHEQIEAPLGPVRVDSSNQRVADKSLKAEGKLFHYLYWAPAERTSLEVYRNYEQALKAKGFTILFGCDQPRQCEQQGLQHYAGQWTSQSSTFAGGYSSLSVIDDNGNYPPRYLVASRETPEGALYVTLTVREPSSTQQGYGTGGPYYLQVLETRKMQMDAVQILDAKAIGGELEKAGKAAFYGIEFDTNSAVIRAGSAPQLQQMAGALKAQAQLKVFIVGHTDNVGSYENNRSLSQRRAQSVIDALAGQGIDKGRMQAVGVANVAPAASNASDAGRAKNRRVEMVVQ
jgi:outer membrane protein OmpA-like peptidoglycan-associated protein